MRDSVSHTRNGSARDDDRARASRREKGGLACARGWREEEDKEEEEKEEEENEEIVIETFLCPATSLF